MFNFLKVKVMSTHTLVRSRLLLTGYVISSKLWLFSTIVWMHHQDANEMHEAKSRSELHKNVTRYFEQTLEVTPHKTAAVH